MRVRLFTDINTTTDIPVGEYPIGEENVGNAGLGGGSEVGLDWGTWFFEQAINKDGDLATTNFAPTRTGTVKVEKTGDQYTITVNAIDDRENKITASYTGALEFVNNANRAAAKQTKVAKKSYNKGKNSTLLKTVENSFLLLYNQSPIACNWAFFIFTLF
ncbi:hypothetical protein QNH98_16315 [Myroides sp. mNGS23_01]|nr:hypothetical protein [Myroides sp. mNGS23_01]WHT38550.1 hypothetical protein QNH98_16315 [Myroides sp. mNGS23_01]